MEASLAHSSVHHQDFKPHLLVLIDLPMWSCATGRVWLVIHWQGFPSN